MKVIKKLRFTEFSPIKTLKNAEIIQKTHKAELCGFLHYLTKFV